MEAQLFLPKKHLLTSFPVGCYFRVCTSPLQGPPRDFGVYDGRGNSTSCYTADGYDGWKTRVGKQSSVLEWDRDTVAYPPADLRIVFVEQLNPSGETTGKQGWMLLEDMTPLTGTAEASKESRIRASLEARIESAKKSLSFLPRQEEDARHAFQVQEQQMQDRVAQLKRQLDEDLERIAQHRRTYEHELREAEEQLKNL